MRMCVAPCAQGFGRLPVLSLPNRCRAALWARQPASVKHRRQKAARRQLRGLYVTSSYGSIYSCNELFRCINMCSLLAPMMPWLDLYFEGIRFIGKVKTGPFFEHSPILNDIATSVPSWEKVASGMIRMCLLQPQFFTQLLT